MSQEVAVSSVAPVVVDLELALTQLARRVVGLRVSEHLAGTGITLDKAGYGVLTVVSMLEPARVSDVASRLNLDLSTVSRQVAHLERSGLVGRQADPDDGRASRLSTTARGHDVLDRVRQSRQRLLADALAGWSQDDRRHLASLTTRLVGDLAPVDLAACLEHPTRTSPTRSPTMEEAR